MVAIVFVGRQCWILSPWKRGWVRCGIEGQCLKDNASFCLAHRVGKDGCFSWSIDFSFSEAINSFEIINSLSYNPLSVFWSIMLYIHTYVYMCMNTFACAHGQGEETPQTSTHQLALGFWKAFNQPQFPPVPVEKAKWVPSSSWETSPQMTCAGTSSLLFHDFLSGRILLLQFEDNQFILICLPHQIRLQI